MKENPRLNLPSCEFKIRKCSNGVDIWDVVRNKWLVLTPEEWVRQHILHWLIRDVKIASTSIVCEYAVNVNGLAQRADIVAFSPGVKPIIIIECKAPDISINKSVFAQVARYNSTVKADYMIISNGMSTYYFKCSTKDGEYQQINSAMEFIESLSLQ